MKRRRTPTMSVDSSSLSIAGNQVHRIGHGGAGGESKREK